MKIVHRLYFKKKRKKKEKKEYKYKLTTPPPKQKQTQKKSFRKSPHILFSVTNLNISVMAQCLEENS